MKRICNSYCKMRRCGKWKVIVNGIAVTIVRHTYMLNEREYNQMHTVRWVNFSRFTLHVNAIFHPIAMHITFRREPEQTTAVYIQ